MKKASNLSPDINNDSELINVKKFKENNGGKKPYFLPQEKVYKELILMVTIVYFSNNNNIYYIWYSLYIMHLSHQSGFLEKGGSFCLNVGPRILLYLKKSRRKTYKSLKKAYAANN